MKSPFPQDWKEYTIGDCLRRVEHPVEVDSDALYTQIGIRSHGKGLFYKEPVTGESLGSKAVYWVEPDCFILNIVFAWEQAIGKTTQAEVGMIGSHRFPMYKPVNNLIDIDYLISYLLTKRGTDILEAASPGGAGRNRTLGQDRFMKSRIVLPPLDEQQKIAEILATQDKAIELQGRKIEELKRFKKGCLERMFPRKGQKVPEKRFPGFTDDWEQHKLGEIGSVSMCRRIFKEQTSETGDIPFYKIGTFGAEPDAFISRELFEEYKSKYPYPKKGDILISASGSIGRTVEFSGNNEYFQDSNIVWLSHGERLTNSFLKCFYSVVKWAGIEGSTIKRLYNDNILNTVICMPSVPEQERIGLFFENLDHLITLHQRKLEEMKKQKKALMQLLLTGIVRVKA